jgi:hypothetical protein
VLVAEVRRGCGASFSKVEWAFGSARVGVDRFAFAREHSLHDVRYYLDAYVWRRTIAEQAARAADLARSVRHSRSAI